VTSVKKQLAAILIALATVTSVDAQEEHHHPSPEHLGVAHLKTSCSPAVTAAFDRATALLHSFAYDDADLGFADVAARDPACAMAHWGRAMTHYHQLWEAPAGAGLAAGIAEIGQAERMVAGQPRERVLIAALGTYYADANRVPAAARALRYSDAMAAGARDNPTDDEIAAFYALSLVATASPTDHTHARQKRAADILEPIWQRQPDHPGVPHYLIHAYDSAELARRGLPAARAYAKIAPSAPHALHMPSHIFTRLGLWDDSIASNIAARDAARAQGDVGEALHAMDYLTYAYLQRGLTADAARQVAALHAMTGLSATGFKIGYAANAMPVRLAIETRDWTTASQLTPLPGTAPQITAVVWWARALGKLRAAPPQSADADIGELQACREALRAAKDDYWMAQVDALLKSAQAWHLVTAGDGDAAVTTMTAAADEEDGLEKLPVTPGPIVPAREQLGELFLRIGKPREALVAFDAALALAPRRLGALRGKADAEHRITSL
jgi:tetratricopeptide (TPR) repeat protein